MLALTILLHAYLYAPVDFFNEGSQQVILDSKFPEGYELQAFVGE